MFQEKSAKPYGIVNDTFRQVDIPENKMLKKETLVEAIVYSNYHHVYLVGAAKSTNQPKSEGDNKW